MKTNKMTDKLPQEAALAEDMLAEMEKIDDMKVSHWWKVVIIKTNP